MINSNPTPAPAQNVVDAPSTVAPTAPATAAPTPQSAPAAAPTPIRGFRSFLPGSSAYNNAFQAAYVSQTQTDIASNVDRIEQESGSDLPSYAAKVAGYADGLINAAPPEYKTQLQLMLNARIAAGATRIQGQALAINKQQTLDSFLQGMDARAQLVLKSADGPAGLADAQTVAAVHDTNAQVDALLRGGIISAEQAEHYRTSFQQTLSDQVEGARLNNEVDKLMALAHGNVESGDHALAALADRSDLDDHDLQAIAEEYKKQRDMLTYERSRQLAGQSADLAARLANGEYGPDVEQQAHMLYQQGAIGPEEYASKIGDSIRNQRAHIESDSGMQAVREALQAGHGLDPQNPQQVKAVDTLWQTLVAQTNEPPGSERYIAGAAQMARELNIVPPSVLSWARVSLMSGDPQKASVAAAAVSRIHDANPAAAPFAQEPKLQAFSSLINDNLTAGLDPVRAYQLAQGTVNMNEQQRKLLDQRYAQGKFDASNNDALHATLKSSDQINPSIWTHIPDAPPAMQGEYGQLVREYFKATAGDITKARQLAGKAILGQWGTSEVNGAPELVKWPPESTYGLPDAVIRADVVNSLRQIGYTGDTSTVRLVPNGMTDRTKGRVYSLQEQTPNGPDIVLDKNNRPLVYALPLGQSFNAARQRLLDEKLAQARVERQAQRQNTGDRIKFENQLASHYLHMPRGFVMGAK
ncbi:MAG TPA: hypothetical protein VFX20_19965 [Steroidobacteraceae bacterium]|nr:hypothetical protein [Steroidobacteraceae bacterium]